MPAAEALGIQTEPKLANTRPVPRSGSPQNIGKNATRTEPEKAMYLAVLAPFENSR